MVGPAAALVVVADAAAQEVARAVDSDKAVLAKVLVDKVPVNKVVLARPALVPVMSWVGQHKVGLVSADLVSAAPGLAGRAWVDLVWVVVG